ncbi:histone-lysine N-methyltransferase SETMAR [Trichonephila inaurata madagascariensis]|uniref:Histone-lysine N-methyltransferase SETMAR n=1 Tax=Trichonephila inaurata madagascariensis TaxID=2747483 RepID=A0A8X7BNT8_9ARAC|nr:histone-lysine N-methyltransferase SETMAR [Trichonephila inaurata madagascariensis]
MSRETTKNTDYDSKSVDFAVDNADSSYSSWLRRQNVMISLEIFTERRITIAILHYTLKLKENKVDYFCNVKFQKLDREICLSLCDKAQTGRPQALDDEAPQVAIEEDSSQTCGELARHFTTSSEMIRLPLLRFDKTYRLSKWVPHTLLEVHKQQRVEACLSLLSRHRRASDYRLFHFLDNHLRGKSFSNEADLRQALTDFFVSPEFYRMRIEQLETRWQKVLDTDW